MVKIKVSVAQTCSQKFDLDATLAKLEDILRVAGDSKFIVFPEAFLGGYPKFSHFGAEVGIRRDEGRDEYLRYYSGAIDIPSQTTDRIGQLARQYDMSMVVGVIEKDGGTLYCTAIYVDSNAGYVAKHRKLMPTGSERLIWGFGDRSTLTSQHLRITSTTGNTLQTNCSATICWEN